MRPLLTTMNPNRKLSDSSASLTAQAAALEKAKKDHKPVPDIPLQDNGEPALTAEQARTIRMMESMNEKLRVDRMRAENEIRIAAERRAAVNPKPKP